MTAKCSVACENDRESICRILKLAFPEDSVEEIELLTSRFFSFAYVMREDDTVVSVLFLLPAHLEYRQTRYPVAYIYAGATDPAYRGRGYYRRLIDYICRVAKDNGVKAVFLRPADDQLAKSYARMGFVVSMPREMCAGDVPKRFDNGRCISLDAKQYRLLRNTALRQQMIPFIDWDECVLTQWFAWCQCIKTDNAFGIISSDEDAIHVWEWFGDDVLSLIAHAPHRQTARCFTACSAGNGTVAGSLLPLDKDLFTAMPPIYMGYAME